MSEERELMSCAIRWAGKREKAEAADLLLVGHSLGAGPWRNACVAVASVGPSQIALLHVHYTHAYIHIHTSKYIYIHRYTYAYIYMHIRTYTYTHTYTYTTSMQQAIHTPACAAEASASVREQDPGHEPADDDTHTQELPPLPLPCFASSSCRLRPSSSEHPRVCTGRRTSRTCSFATSPTSS